MKEDRSRPRRFDCGTRRLDGVTVDEPYLRLVGIGAKGRRISFGQRKAAALAILEDELRDWLNRGHGWWQPGYEIPSALSGLFSMNCSQAAVAFRLRVAAIAVPNPVFKPATRQLIL